MNKNRIVFFGSGEFPIMTLKMLIKDFNIVGIVTSHDERIFKGVHVSDIANENNIPLYISDSVPGSEILPWLQGLKPDIACVISYKYLYEEIVDEFKFAFNIHASLLPLLKGAAPINWAIRYGFTKTGVTAINLNNCIDEGEIYGSREVDIYSSDNYRTLGKRLSEASVFLTKDILHSLDETSDWSKLPYSVQPSVPKKYDSLIFHAPKLTKENTFFAAPARDNDNGKLTAEEIYNMIRSLSPNIGMGMQMRIELPNNNVKFIDFKIYDAELVPTPEKWDYEYDEDNRFYTDWKHYLYIHGYGLDTSKVVSIKKIQQANRKILGISDFLKGFQNFKKANITLL